MSNCSEYGFAVIGDDRQALLQGRPSVQRWAWVRFQVVDDQLGELVIICDRCPIRAPLWEHVDELDECFPRAEPEEEIIEVDLQIVMEVESDFDPRTIDQIDNIGKPPTASSTPTP